MWPIVRPVTIGALAVAAALSLAAAPAPAVTGQRLGSFDQPVYVASPPGDPATQAVVERYGRIVLVHRGRVLRRPLIDMRRRVLIGDPDETSDQRGLLSMAFAPDYARSGRFYVDYVDRDGRLRVDAARRGSSRTQRILDLGVATTMHHGGQLQFGPDGKLYVSTGMGDDPGSSQDPDRPGGKILRLDPRRPGQRPEIVALGLRNPWRFSFDRRTGLALIGDVGESHTEEVDVLDPAGATPVNFGWPFAEGRTTQPGAPAGLTAPAIAHAARAPLVLDHRRLRRPRPRAAPPARPLPLRRPLHRRPVERAGRRGHARGPAPGRRPGALSRLVRRGRPRAPLRRQPQRRRVAAADPVYGVNLTVITSPSAIG